MKQHVRDELVRFGFPIPTETTYSVRCEWRPPKDQWSVHGSRPRTVLVKLLDAGDHRSAAIEAGLFVIAHHRGKATARSVTVHNRGPLAIDGVCFDWSWYDGVITYGAEVVEVVWL